MLSTREGVLDMTGDYNPDWKDMLEMKGKYSFNFGGNRRGFGKTKLPYLTE